MKRSDPVINEVIIDDREDIPEDIKEYIHELHSIIHNVDGFRAELSRGDCIFQSLARLVWESLYDDKGCQIKRGNTK